MLFKKFAPLSKDERGATSTEYALALVFIFLAVVGSWSVLGDELRGIFNEHSDAMAAARKDASKT